MRTTEPPNLRTSATEPAGRASPAAPLAADIAATSRPGPLAALRLQGTAQPPPRPAENEGRAEGFGLRASPLGCGGARNRHPYQLKRHPCQFSVSSLFNFGPRFPSRR